MAVFLAAALGDLLTYTVTSFQLGFAFPDPAGGFMVSAVKFLGVFFITQVPIAIAEGKRSFFFAFYRKIILLIPLIYILPNFISNGVLAVMLAEPVSDLLTTGTNAIFFKRFINDKLK